MIHEHSNAFNIFSLKQGWVVECLFDHRWSNKKSVKTVPVPPNMAKIRTLLRDCEQLSLVGHFSLYLAKKQVVLPLLSLLVLSRYSGYMSKY